MSKLLKILVGVVGVSILIDWSRKTTELEQLKGLIKEEESELIKSLSEE